MRFDSLEEQRKGRRAVFDAVVKFKLQSRHLAISVDCDTTVTSNYGVGTITQPDGTATPTNNRISMFRIKQGEQWKQVHNHISPLRPPQ